jgi:hypothetical protein
MACGRAGSGAFSEEETVAALTVALLTIGALESVE